MIEQTIDVLKMTIEYVKEFEDVVKARNTALLDISNIAGSISEGEGTKEELDDLLTEIYKIAVTFGSGE